MQIGQLHDTASSIEAVTGGGNQALIVYQLTDDASGSFTTLASLDGGTTWQPAGTAGVPTGFGHNGTTVIGSPDDGSLVAGFTDYANAQSGASSHVTTFLAWKPGDTSWRTVAQPTLLESVPGYILLTVDHNTRHSTIWIAITSAVEGYNYSGPAPTYSIQRFRVG